MSKKRIAVVLVAGILIGYLFTSLIGMVGVLTSPHQQIISRIMIKEPDFGITLTYSYASGGNIEYGQGTFSWIFTPYKTYSFSTWIFSRYGDAEVAVTIWGPGDDGRTFDVTVSRLTGHALEVYVGGTLMLRFTKIDPCDPAVQYLGFEYFQIGT